MRALFAHIARLASSPMPVLIQGETGVGKESLARTIHRRSPRAKKPFVVVDCGSVHEHELITAVDTAASGTVFLDEIGELPRVLQPKVARLLERGARFIADTRHDLVKRVSDGAFREDLYFRIAVLKVSVPPLRERVEDIPFLATTFLGASNSHLLTAKLLDRLCAHRWNGNVRELRNVIERLTTLADRDPLDLFPSRAENDFPPVDLDEPFKRGRERWLSHFEREYLRGVMARADGHISTAAQLASIDRAYVYRLVRKHGL